MTCGSIARFLDPLDDVVLDLDIGAAGGLDRSREGNADIAIVVDRLIRQRHEIAGTRSRVERNEQAAGGGLEDCSRDNIAYPELDAGRRAAIGEGAGEALGLVSGENVDRLGRELDQGIGDSLQLLLEDVHGLWSINWEKGAAADRGERNG